MRPHRLLPTFAALAVLAGCGSGDDGTIGVAIIGNTDAAFASGLRLSREAQLVRAATQSGLVGLNSQGEVVPALAETWIVTDDGLSFIFRLRQTRWPDGSEMTAQSAREALVRAMEGLEGTSLGLDLSPIEEVRAMAGRVIEIRLAHPEPALLQLLAQPELALMNGGSYTGTMTVVARESESNGAMFRFKPPAERGLPDDEDWQAEVRDIALRVGSAEQSLAFFEAGEVALVMNGDLGNLPLVETGPLSSGTLRVDSTIGIFGLLVRDGSGLLGDDGVREALAMAIDRPALLANYNLGGWQSTTRPVSPGLPNDRGQVGERWEGAEIESLRAEAARRVAAWRRANDAGDLSQPVNLYVWMDDGPGWDELLSGLSVQFAPIGIRLQRAEERRQAELVLIDQVARYASPRWFLNQFNCALDRGMCSEEADALVREAMAQDNANLRQTLFARAEAELTLANVFIPIASPLRWSLVRGGVDGFAPNAYAFHPLPPLAEIPR